jgi:beta propeller domain-containing protein
MKIAFVLTFLATITAAGLFTHSAVSTTNIAPVKVAAARKKMKAFKSEQELKRYFRQLEVRAKRHARTEALGAGNPTTDAPAPPVAKGVAADMSAVKSEGTTALPKRGLGAGDDESITNTQHAGVDEGDIVKLHGNHLVILRRGRIFTVKVGDGELKPVSVIDSFGPETEPEGAWYDEMLISGDTIVIIGYSYARDGTEVGLFNINAQGQLSYRGTYQMRSDDYYSSRNYASRLIGDKLIFYAPTYFYPGENDPSEKLPAVRRWHKGASEKEFQRILPAQRVYQPEFWFDTDEGVALHTVTVCNLANGGFDCQATSVLGPEGNVFYVSPESVYVWATSWNYNTDKSRSILFRMPLDGGVPSALRVSGGPVDQFSFLESDDQHLNVLVRSETKGDGMWGAEVAEGDVALMRVPLSSFSDGSAMVPASSYRRLRKPEGETFQNRFVGKYLLYGTGSGWDEPETTKGMKDLFVVEWATRSSYKLQLPHGIDRIEPMGDDAVVIGTDGKDLHFTSIRLGDSPEIASRYTRHAASQGELRSHGFFYKPEDENGGMLGLPISLPGRAGYEHLFDNSAAILFLRNDSLQFREMGELGAQAEKAVDDRCRASCVDWYGNARPLFVRGRVFALLGYELIEGTVQDGRIREVRRISYAPNV